MEGVEAQNRGPECCGHMSKMLESMLLRGERFTSAHETLIDVFQFSIRQEDFKVKAHNNHISTAHIPIVGQAGDTSLAMRPG